MEGLVLDIENVRTRVLPDIKKAGDRVQDAYNASIILKTKLPSNFSYRDIVGKIGSSIHDVKKEIDNVDLIVNKKLAQIVYSESRANARAAQLASAINSISAKDSENKKKVSFAASTAVKAGVERAGKNTSNSGAKMVSKSETAIKDLNNKSGEKLKAIGLVAIKMGTETALGGVAAVNNFGNKVFDFAKTGAKTFIKTASIINNFSSRIAVDVSKKIGSKVTNGIKTASKWVKETSKSVTSWLSDKFNSAKSWANNKIKETGAWIDKTFKAIWAFNNEVFNFVWDKMKKVGASVANGFLAFIKGILHLWEALEKFGAIYLSCKATIVTGLIDIVRGITTGKWDWKLTKGLWKTTKSIVTYQYVNKAYDWFYSTKVGRTLDNYAYKPFKSDGLVCQILDGVGYATGIIIVSVCTFGAATPAFLAITAGSAGIGKYTAEEWNKNSLSISYEGQELELKIDYEKYLEITSLKAGESATIEQQFQDANGGVSKITFKIIANGDGTYSVTDDNGNQFEFNGVKESSTAKGLGIGTLKGLWEGAQYYIGGEIGSAQFNNILGNISNPVIRQLTRSGMRIGLDGITGALEVPFQTVVTMLSEGVSWKEAWNSQGGWDAVKSQLIIAGGMSSLGEGIDLGKVKLRSMKSGMSFSDALKEAELNTAAANSNLKSNKKLSRKSPEARLKDVDAKIEATRDEWFELYQKSKQLSKSNSEAYNRMYGNKVGGNNEYANVVNRMKELDLKMKNLQSEKSLLEAEISKTIKVEATPKSLKTFKDKLCSNIPKRLDDTEKAKLLYNRLNDEVNYSAKYLGAERTRNAKVAADIYNQKIDLNNFTDTNNIVCANWAQMYCDLLNENGIHAEIRGGNNVGSHKWCVFKADGKYYMADATNGFINANDLTRQKAGLKSGGFVEIEEWQYNDNGLANYFVKNPEQLEELLNKQKKKLNKIDKKIGADLEDIENYFGVSKESNTEKDLKKLGLNSDASSLDIIKAKFVKRFFDKFVRMGPAEGCKTFDIYSTSEFTSAERSAISYNYLLDSDDAFCVLYKVKTAEGNINYLHSGDVVSELTDAQVSDLMKNGYKNFR